jgi:hypothetical protein
MPHLPAAFAFSFSFSNLFFSASAFRAFSSRDFLNIFTNITKIDVTENKIAITDQMNILTTHRCEENKCVNHMNHDRPMNNRT